MNPDFYESALSELRNHAERVRNHAERERLRERQKLIDFYLSMPPTLGQAKPQVKRNAHEPLVRPDVAAYLEDWFAR